MQPADLSPHLVKRGVARRFKSEYCILNEVAMVKLDFHPIGRHFLQIPGPSPVPDRILRAISLPTIDHRGPEFGVLGLKLLAGLKTIFKTRHPVMVYPASG